MIVWWENGFHSHEIAINAAVWDAANLKSSIMQINIDSPSVGDNKVAYPGKVEIGHKWTTWDSKWENYIGFMVEVTGISLDSVTRHDIPVGWTESNEQDHLKYQAIQIGPAWEANKMAVYTKLKACCLDGEGWSWIKVFYVQKYGGQATANLLENY